MEDDVDTLESLKALLQRSLGGCKVLTATSGPDGLVLLRTEAVDLIVGDYRMSPMDGLDFFSKSREMAPTAMRILITAFPDVDVAIRAINDAAVSCFLVKPIPATRFLEVVRTLMSVREAEVARAHAYARAIEKLRRQRRPRQSGPGRSEGSAHGPD